MIKENCLLINCQQPQFNNTYYCLFHYLKFTQHNGYVPCSYCYRYQVPVEQHNHYVKNRYHSQFWNTEQSQKFICFSCLYDWQELKVIKDKKPTYYNYKYRYYSNSRRPLTN